MIYFILPVEQQIKLGWPNKKVPCYQSTSALNMSFTMEVGAFEMPTEIV